MNKLFLFFYMLTGIYFSNCSDMIDTKQNQKEKNTSHWSKEYTGYLAETGLIITLRIENNDNVLNGTIYTSDSCERIPIKGALTKDTIIIMTQHNNEKLIFKGMLLTNNHQKYSDSIDGLWLYNKSQPFNPLILVEQEITTYDVQIKTSSTELGNPTYYTQKISYPELCSTSSQYNKEVFNKYVQSLISEYTTVRSEEDLAIMLQNGNISISESTEILPIYHNPYLMSMQIFQSDYVGGTGANNNQWYKCYDLINGKELALKDIFLEESGYIKIINECINQDLKKQSTPDFDLSEYLLPPNQIPDQYYFKNDGLYFFIRRSNITNILGIEDIRIPLEKIKPLLKDNSVVSTWLNQR